MNELNGVILINKPAGISSAGLINRLKESKIINKVGHAGTLDPFATGLIVCCINKATRLARFFLNSDKKYRAIMRLGTSTDTHDSTGIIVSKKDFSYVKFEEVEEVFSKFHGRIYQTPPAFSALKHCGIPLYKLARKGIHISKSPRQILVYNLNICNVSLPEVVFEIHCSSGTYVRKICYDIGKILGCGGHLKSLCRIASGNFLLNNSYKLEYLESVLDTREFFDCVLPMSDVLDFMPGYVANQNLVRKIRNGVKLRLSDFVNCENLENVLTSNTVFFRVVDDRKSLVAVLTNSVDSEYYSYCCVFS